MLMQQRSNFLAGGSSAFKQTAHQLKFWSTLHVLPNATSYAWSSQPIGDPNADRVLIIAGYAAGDAALNLACTVNSVSASVIANNAAGLETMFAFYIIRSTGQNANINFSSTTTLRILDACYWTCLLPVPDALFAVQSGISSGSAVGASITIPKDGFATTVCIERANAVDMQMSINQSFVERADEFANNGNFAAADREVTQQFTDLGCTWSLNASTTKNGVVFASFGH